MMHFQELVPDRANTLVSARQLPLRPGVYEPGGVLRRLVPAPWLLHYDTRDGCPGPNKSPRPKPGALASSCRSNRLDYFIWICE